MTAWTTLLRTVWVSCLRSASNNQMEVKGFISQHVQIKQLYKKVRFLVILGSASNMLLGTAFISRYIRRISPTAGTISLVNSSPAATSEAAEGGSVIAVQNENHREPVGASCIIARSVRLLPTSKILLRVKKLAGGTHQVETHNNSTKMFSATPWRSQAEGHWNDGTHTATGGQCLKICSKMYDKHFDKRVRRYSILKVGNWVYLGWPPVWKKTTNESVSEDPSRKLASKKEGPYRVTKVHMHTVMINVKKLHNITSIDRVILASEAQRTSEAATQAGSPTELDGQTSIGDKRNSRE